MDRGEFVNIATAIKMYYPRFEVLDSKVAMELWYSELKEMPYEVAELAVRKHVNTSQWPPTIADLKAGMITKQEWSEGWEECLRAISRFGQYQEKEALESLSEPTKTVVKRLGWRALCTSENINQDRANFRMAFEAAEEKRADSLLIEQIRHNLLETKEEPNV